MLSKYFPKRLRMHRLLRASTVYLSFKDVLTRFDSFYDKGVVGWCDGSGLASSAGASYTFDDSKERAYFACSRCRWGLFGHFYSHLSSFGRRSDID